MARAPQTREPGSLIHCTVSQAGFKKVSQAKSTAQSQLPIESLVAVLQRLTLTCMRVRYTGLFIRIHVAVSKHGGMVMDPS